MNFHALFPEGLASSIVGEDVDLSDITIDSRRVKEGVCFVALRGANSDGHDFIERAIESGASAIIAEEIPEGLRVPHAIVEDSRQALGYIAARFFSSPSKECKVIGVTGTNGKTTTAHIVSHILAFNHRRVGRIGTTGIFWPGTKIKTPNTTPESIVLQRCVRAMVDDKVDDLCMEVSSHGLETGRLKGLLFDVGIFLNLTQDHLDFHSSMANYFDAKKRLFTEHLPKSMTLGKSPKAVISIDSSHGLELVKLVKEPITFGISGGDYHASEIASDLRGTRFLLRYPNGEKEVRTNLIGAFNVSNILASIAACAEIGIPVEASIEALAGNRPINVDGRLERVPSYHPESPHVFVDFAHTPDALENVLKTLREIVGDNKIWVVFGAGGDRDVSKRPLMGEIALRFADQIVVTSDNPRSEDPQKIVDDIVAEKGDRFTSLLDRREAIGFAISEAADGDVVLIAGKGHESYQEINGVKKAFNDSNIAREVLLSLVNSVNKNNST